MKNFDIKNIVASLQLIKNAVKIPINDSLHLTPPQNSSISSSNAWPDANIKNVNDKNLNIKKHIIESEEKTSQAIRAAGDKRRDWSDEDELGTEALAWYASFHKTNYWGIYVPYTGLLRFASYFLPFTQNADRAIQMAWDALIAHESIHYGIDVACAHMEIISNTAIYINAHASMRSPQGHIPDEEQLAEAALLRFLNVSSTRTYFLSKIEKEEICQMAVRRTGRLPSGYRDSIDCVKPLVFTEHLNSYLKKISYSAFSNTQSNNIKDLNLSGLIPLIKSGFYNPSNVDYSDCPIYVFDDTSANSGMSNVIHFISQISHIEEGPGFMDKVVPQYLKQWIHTKELLGNPNYPKNKKNLDFKRWEKEDLPEKNIRVWSVRVGNKTNMRAHIEEQTLTKRWIATKFGDADKMGHHKIRK